MRKPKIIKKMMKFSDIEEGCTFLDKDGDLMMRLDPNFTTIKEWNVVCLETGRVYAFSDDDQFEVVDVEIEILGHKKD